MNVSLKSAMVAAGLLTLHGSVFADQQMVALPDKPIYVGGGVQPMVMLDITKDHQLHMKAYNDYTDLDGDGVVERTYKHSINYYGYFDSRKCYSYNTSSKLFEPAALAPDKYCNGSQWSGNFLNWATMTRMDTVRKILYGGYRSTDTSSSTILERNFLPPDAHSFVKYYDGDDLGKVTPFAKTNAGLYEFIANVSTDRGVATTGSLPTAAGTHTIRLLGKWNDRLFVGDQIELALAKGNANKIVAPIKTITHSTTGSGVTTITIDLKKEGVSGTVSNRSTYHVTNLTRKDSGISMCNSTPSSSNVNSEKINTSQFPPMFKIARGNFEFWSANERKQCEWSENSSGTMGNNGNGSNNNNVGISGMNANYENPNKSRDGLGGGDFVVRVEVCKAQFIQPGTDEADLGKCKQYGSSWKPVGLLQKYADTDLIRFGLMTGSYQKNLSGGVLRKNIGDMKDEIDLTNGTFKAISANGSIIQTLNKMRIFGFRYGSGNNNGYYGEGDKCSWGLTSITEGSCRSYGNPMSEVYQESIRYLAGKAATPAYTYGNTSADADLGLPAPKWVDPLNRDNFCAPLNVLVFNASSSGEDKDLGTKSLNEFTYPVVNETIKSATDRVGQVEGLNGTVATFGATSNTSKSASDYALCSAKTITTLGDIFGICPEGPSNNGSYHMAGIASVVKNTRIRNFNTIPASDVNSLKVNSYAIQLASNTPTISIPVNGKEVKLSPIYRLVKSSGVGSGALVDFKIASINQDGSAGSLYINWEDSQQGGDYDQDVTGIINWEVTSAGKLKITTQVIAASADSGGQGFGYSISGTSKDGPHFHSGINNFSFTDPAKIDVYRASDNVKISGTSGSFINSSGGCSSCVNTSPATYALYDATGNTAEDLKDPLYYLAKYGGFKDKNGNGIPDLVSEWDAFNNTTGDAGADGIPDNYFYAINPLQLENSLQQAFNSILVTSSSSSVAANSTFLRNNTLVYQAKYFTGDWSGQFIAYNLTPEGTIGSTAWEADVLMNSIPANNRQIVTYNSTSKRGVPYRWSGASNNGLSANIISALNKNAAGTVDNKGEQRLNWARGSSVDENSSFRARTRTKLGDIIESSPVYVGSPESYVNDPTFKVFQKNNKNRTPLVYVGANDGMLHAFDALLGTLKFSYMPGVIAEGQLVSKASSTAYGDTVAHMYGVNGSPTVADVKFGQTCSLLTSDCNTDTGWKTVLVGGLAHGGKGIYALDVTNPLALTEANAANIALWEFTSANHNGVGYTFSQPQITRICNTRVGVFKPQLCTDSTPVAIFGGGINPASGKGTLFVVNLQNGSLIKSIDVPGGINTAPNALSSASIVDVDGDGIVEYAYAGDLNGKMWKFDLQSVADAGLAFGNEPLYHAVLNGKNQPITSAPELYNHPQGGYLVLFGTGKYIEANDLGTTDTQTFYSIWDKNLTVPTLTNRSNLQEQTTSSIIYTPDGDFNEGGYEYRKSSSNYVDWGTKLGWYMDMGNVTSNDPGERIIYSPQIYNSGIVSFSSLVPAGGVCTFGGYSWNYFLDAVTGAALTSNPFGNDGEDLSSRRSTNGIVTPATLIYVGNGISYAPQSGTSGNLEISKLNLSGGRTGRVSWREIR